MKRYILGSMLLALAGCAGGGSTAPSVPNQGCLAYNALVVPPTLVNPAPNATGVHDGQFWMQMNWDQNPNTTGAISLVPQSGAPVHLVSFTTGQGAGDYAIYLPALAANTKYTLTVTFQFSAGCNASEPAGSFTTQ